MKNFIILRAAPAWEILDSIVEERSLGSMTFPCSHCSAKFWQSEKLSTSTKDCFKFSLCCGQGKVVLPNLATPPGMLRRLLITADKQGRDFRDHIRAYNSA